MLERGGGETLQKTETSTLCVRQENGRKRKKVRIEASPCRGPREKKRRVPVVQTPGSRCKNNARLINVNKSGRRPEKSQRTQEKVPIERKRKEISGCCLNETQKIPEELE